MQRFVSNNYGIKDKDFFSFPYSPIFFIAPQKKELTISITQKKGVVRKVPLIVIFFYQLEKIFFLQHFKPIIKIFINN